MDAKARVTDAVRGSPLADRPVLPIAVPRSDEVAYCIPIQPNEVRVAWALMRERSDALGRWPLAVSSWDDKIENVLRFGEVPDEGPRAVLEHARRLRAEDVIAEWHEWSVWRDPYYELEWPTVVDLQLSRTQKRVQAAPSPAPVLDDAFPRDPLRLEEWLLDFEETRQPTTSPEGGEYLEWFEPPPTCAVAMLPTALSEEALAYTGFFGAYGPHGLASVVAIARHWRQRHGAELVANWGTILQFVVRQPPTTLSDAFRLAHEQEVVAPYTTSLFSTRDHARALLCRTEWLLHEHP